MKSIIRSCSKISDKPTISNITTKINNRVATYNLFEFATFKQFATQLDFFKIQIGFKNLISQSKQINSVIEIFKKYQDQKYMGIMYSYALRSLGRILRKDFLKRKQQIHRFLGQNYSKLKSLDISNLQAQNIVDIVSFILYNQNTGLTISQETRQVVDIYLERIIQVFKQNQNIIQNRRFSQILFAARSSQLFKSKFYSQFLKLIETQIHCQYLNMYRLKFLFNFLLKMQHLTSIEQELQVFEVIIAKLSDQKILQKIEMINIRIIYGNLMQIMQNYLFVKSIKKHPFVDEIENSFIKNLSKIQAIQVIKLCQIMIKYQNQNSKLFKLIFCSLIESIGEDGETSFNPCFVIAMISILTLKQTKIFKSKWNLRFLKMVKCYYFEGKHTKFQNLEFLQHYISLIIANKIFRLKQIQFLQKYYQNDECSIIPYDRLSFTMQNYHYQTINWSKIYGDIMNLQQIYKLQFKVNLFQGVFIQLKQQILLQIRNNQNLDLNGDYTEKKQFNRKSFILVLINICKMLQKHSLILQIIKIELQFAKNISKSELTFALSNIINKVQISSSQQHQFIKLIVSQYEQIYCNLITQKQSCYKAINSQSRFFIALHILQRYGNQKHLIKFIKNKEVNRLFIKFQKNKFITLIFNLHRKNKIQLSQFQLLMWRALQQYKIIYQWQQLILLIEKILQVKLQNQTFIKYLVNLIISNKINTQKIVIGLLKLHSDNKNNQIQKYLQTSNPKMYQKLLQNLKGFFSNFKIFESLSLIELKLIFLNLKPFLDKIQHQKLRKVQSIFLKRFLKENNLSFQNQLNQDKMGSKKLNKQYNLYEDIFILKNIFVISPGLQIHNYINQILTRIKKIINNSVIKAYDLFTILKILCQNKIYHSIIDQHFVRELLADSQFLNRQQVLNLISYYPMQKTGQILMSCIPFVLNDIKKNIKSFLRIYCVTNFDNQQVRQQNDVKKLIERLIKETKDNLNQQVLIFLNFKFKSQTKGVDSSISFNKVQDTITIQNIQRNINLINDEKDIQYFDVSTGKIIKSISQLILQKYFRLLYNENKIVVKQKKEQKFVVKNKKTN